MASTLPAAAREERRTDGSEEPAFRVRSVTFAYPAQPPCLRDVSFDVSPGERVAILGANGSGKSTLLKLLDGLAFPSAGSITALLALKRIRR